MTVSIRLLPFELDLSIKDKELKFNLGTVIFRNAYVMVTAKTGQVYKNDNVISLSSIFKKK